MFECCSILNFSSDLLLIVVVRMMIIGFFFYQLGYSLINEGCYITILA